MVKPNTSSCSARGLGMGLPEGQAKEFFWGCTLSKESPTVTWSFEEEEDDTDFLEHTLFLRHAVLGSDAVKEERNIIQVETKNFAGDEVKQPLVSLTLGQKDMCSIDLNFSHETPVIFRLVDGTGPMFLVAQHLVEFPREPEEGEEYEYTEDDATATETDGEESAQAKKRKASTQSARKTKRGKLDTSAGSTENGTDEDEEENADGEDEEEEEEESMEEEEDDDEDDEEEEETPEKKKGAKGKGSKGKAAAAKTNPKKGKSPKAAKPAAKKGKKAKAK